ncbi:outer membrane protein [Flavobacterium cauense R2A-7]|uniref:Outer membrane protein TolC n=1 Tax=Flavobacterium cauense R2A-7 TaxID=1341154 RepID=V6RWL4_9FLAO|nr:TolC family protein [Flavobacterium cauense]ESU18432.1 outer membrane protein [Flavobacterium cauense R2A-7]KGO79461.1 membrane protein [Flavobacterium cauense R2A-7]TWI08089.1 outer membrane protein TolC [Flavobacterium cauense R2A-7]
MKIKLIHISFIFSLLLYQTAISQETKNISINQAIELALQNHPQLAVSKTSVEINQQQAKVAALQRIPTLNFSATASYLGDVFLLDKNFGNKVDVDIPNFGNTFGLQAVQLLYKGGLINKSIEAANLKTQLSELDLEKDKQNIKFLVISNYLDLIRIENQLRVLENNKKLAEERLKNVQKFYEQQMITRNEVIRAQLAIQNLNQIILTATNNRSIVNYQLNIALGFQEGTIIKPLHQNSLLQQENSLDYYYLLSSNNNPLYKSGLKNIEIAEKNIEIIKTDRFPSLSAFGGYNMQRPLMNSFPARDVYLNAWQVGLSLNYSLDNIYKTKAKLKSGKLLKNQASEVLHLTEQNLKTAINAAYVKYNEAIAQEKIALESKRLADENYKITEAKYLNQLAVQAEMIDAQNQKIQADIDYENALINIEFQYYNLIKATGTL